MRSFLIAVLSYLLFGILMLLSLLPLPLMYVLSDLFAFILFYIIGYRKSVVLKNLSDSLPAGVPLKRTAWRFYRYLAEMFMESIRCFTIPKWSLLRRFRCSNPEVMEQFAQQGRSVIVMSGHYGNWEFLIFTMNLIFPHLAVGVGKPLTNKTLNKLINARRSRFGMKIISAANIRESFIEDKHILTASLFLSDQYPGHGKRGFPAVFLGKPTDFMFGAEKYAAEYDYPVVYADMERVRRGKYILHLKVLCEDPASAPYGTIMSAYIRCLEDAIARDPAFWLWSHKRWKQIPGFYK